MRISSIFGAAMPSNSPLAPTVSPLAPTVAAALRLLDQARCDAVFSGADRWQLAVPVEKLLDLGVPRDHIRWMDATGWIELGHEVRQRSGVRRVYAKSQRSNDPVVWCCVLTSLGEVIARSCRGAELAGDSFVDVSASRELANHGSSNGHANGSANVAHTPMWNAQRRILSLGGQTVKCFRGRAPNQVKILSVFEEEGWPAAIDDPLPPSKATDTKRRLHDTIKSLNRNQIHALLRFRGNGTGEMIAWETVAGRAARRRNPK